MSLINQMLKDLEKNNHKQGDDQVSEIKEDSVLPPTPPAKRKIRRLIIIMIAIILVIILAIIFLPKSKSPSSQSTELAATTDSGSVSIKANSESNTTATTASKENSNSSNDDTNAVPASQYEKNDAEQKTESSSQSSVKSQPNNEASDQTATIGQSEIINDSTESRKQPSKSVKNLATAAATGQQQSQAPAISITEPSLTEAQKQAQQYDQAIKYVNQGKNGQAIEILHNILIADPSDKNARLSLAAVLIKEKRLDDAKSLLQDGLKQLPKDPDYVKLYAHILAENGQIYLALTQLVSAQPRDLSQHSEYFSFMASLYLQQQNYRQAKAIYQRLVAQQPLNSLWWAGLGISEQQLGMTIDAYEAFSRANRIGNLPPALQQYVEQSLQP